MADELSYTPLGELCDPERGITYGIVKVGEFVPGGVTVIRGGDIRNGRIVFDAEKSVTEEVSRQFQRTILKGGEIVINLIAEPGHTAIVPPEFAGANVSRDVGVIPLNPTVDHRYVDYYLKSPMAIQWLTSRLQGSVTQKINLGTLKELPIPTPPLEEQSAIAHILGTLDDKIELNRRMNQTLEAMAGAIFKSWFVDFDPVRAKAEGRHSGSPKHIADLFPDRLEDSKLGKIPAGWEVKSIGDIAERVGMGPFGSSIKVETFVPEGVPVISGQHLNGLMLEDNGFNFVTPEHAERLSNSNVRRDDIIFTHAGNIGQVAFIPEGSRYERYVISQRQFFMRCDLSQVTPSFIGLYFKSPEGQHRLLANTSSSGVPSIARPVTYLRTIELVIPPKSILDEFEKLSQPILLRFRRNFDESDVMTGLRNTLLPKLICGELRMSPRV
jgi:type I restriction enzyme S subunit